MSVDHEAVLMLGAKYEKWPEKIVDNYDDYGLERVSPYYDAPDEECFYGKVYKCAGSYNVEKVDPLDLTKFAITAMIDMSEKDIDPDIFELYLMPYGS
jgi:hypothetical protein